MLALPAFWIDIHAVLFLMPGTPQPTSASLLTRALSPLPPPRAGISLSTVDSLLATHGVGALAVLDADFPTAVQELW